MVREMAERFNVETSSPVCGSCEHEDQPEFVHLADPPRPEERVLQTFCGT